MRSAAEVMKALDEASAEIQRVSTKLSKLSIELYEAKLDDEGEIHMGLALRYEAAMDKALIEVFNHFTLDGKKMPAADLRDAMAREAIKITDLPLFLDYRNKVQEIEAMKVWISSQKAAISANQSVLRGERE